jgi:hypothetical protein
MNCSMAALSKCAPRKAELDEPPITQIDEDFEGTYRVRELQNASTDLLYDKVYPGAETLHA